MDWRAEAVRVITTFDVALVRPPFPQSPPEVLINSATAVQSTLQGAVDAGKMSVLEGVSAVTTTLPILCASLKEGSPDKQPSLALYRPILAAVGVVSSLSTYPISSILNDAKGVLGGSVYGEGACTSSASPSPDADAEVALNEATLFRFMAVSKSITADDMRCFLRLSPLELPGATRGQTKGKGKTPPTPAKTNSKGKILPSATHTVSRRLLDTMIHAALPDDCRHVLESYVDNTQKFLDVVGADGALASAILAVYGGRIVPKLKPSSLLPCLDGSLLDYYVDIVEASQGEGHRGTLLTSCELREIPLKQWDAERVHRLASAAASRCVRSGDAAASLSVYTFLYLVFCEGVGRCNADTENVRNLSDTERLFILAVGKALRAVLAVESKNKAVAAAAALSQAYVQSNTGILVVAMAGVPSWLRTVCVFGELLASRPAAVSLCVEALSCCVLLESGTQDGKDEDYHSELQELCDSLNSRCHWFLEAAVRVAPKPESKAAASGSAGGGKKGAAPNEQKTAAAAKSKGKQKNGKSDALKSTSAAEQSTGKGADLIAASPPLPLAEVLSSCCCVLLYSALLQRSLRLRGAASGELPSHSAFPLQTPAFHAVLRAYTYLEHHQPQHLNGALWLNFIQLITFLLWTSTSVSSQEKGREETADAALLECLANVLRSATADTDVMLWLSPLVLPAPSQLNVAYMKPSKLFTEDFGLWLSVVQAAVKAQGATQRVSSPLRRHLFPASPAVVLDQLCSVLDDALLQQLAASIVTSTADDGAVLTASLKRMQSTSWEDETTALSFPSCFLFKGDLDSLMSPEMRSAHTAGAAAAGDGGMDGLGRLCAVLDVLQAEHLALQKAVEAGARQLSQQEMQERLVQSQELAAAHRTFHEAAAARRAAKAANQEIVQAELARRRAQAAARKQEDAAARAKKREVALETMRQRAAQTRTQREERRRQRFVAYQQRLQSEYRVSVFLEHLNLSSARVMATRDALQKVLETITPDDLLEYLVSGVAKVPADMTDDAAEEEDATTEESKSTSVLVQTAEAPKAIVSNERRDFWAEVMDNAAVAEAPSLLDTSPQPAAPAAASVVATAYRKHSFHWRVAPLLDLFYYDGGDEYGNVPAVLPSIRLRVAANVWTPAKVQTLGFPNLREACMRMQQRGLVEMRNGNVQLTLLGFRYHFPFHNPEGMLEVYLREARERVRALLARQDNEGEVLDNESAASASGESSDDEDEEEGGDEFSDDSEDDDDQNRLLPEVEFGI